jgi:uncharacterized protein (DUF736 family)
MSTLGTVQKRADGSYLGKMAMKSYGGPVFFQPLAKTNPNAPDFRVIGQADHGGRFEMGAAWVKTRKDGQGDYVSVAIDFPELPDRLYATLGVMAGQDDGDVFAIIWNRPATAGGAAADPFAGLRVAA